MKILKYIPGIIILLLSFVAFDLAAQVGLNNNTINSSSSAMLDVFSPDKGILIPRLTTVQRNLIPSPAPGLFIYNTTDQRFNYYTGSFWYQIETTFVSDIAGTNKPGGGVSVSSNPGAVADGSAMLDVSDPNRGFLIPRTTPASISSPDNGLMIYDQTANMLKYYFENEWFPVCAVTTGQPGLTGSQGAIGVAINKTGAEADPSAMLDVSAPDKGILIPRLTSVQRNGLSPLAGLTIFNTTSKAIEYYNGSNWHRMNIILPASVSIGASNTTICAGTSVTFTATSVNGGETPSYQWNVNSSPVTGATNSTYSYTPGDADQVTCTMTSSSVCVSGSPATSNLITMTVNPLLPVIITISPSDNPVCAGTLVTFSSVIANGGALPAYQWKSNGSIIAGATNSSYTSTMANGEVISCELTSTATCPSVNPAISNSVTMTVNPLLTASITITPSNNPVCAGTSVTFNSVALNGGSSPQYQWKVDNVNVSGATNSTFTFVPLNNNTVSCTLTSNENCTQEGLVASNEVSMTVNPLLPVGISVSPSLNNVCAGTEVTFSSNIVNGGTAPTYQWKLNNSDIPGATNNTYTYAPENGHTISCTLTSNAVCATGNPAGSNTVTMLVNPLLPVVIAVSPSANPVCAGTEVTFTTSITNGGTAPTYQWKLNNSDIPGATNNTYTYAPENGHTISCTLISNAVCATGNPAGSNTVTMLVNPLLPVVIAVSSSANPVCAGTSVTFTSSITNGGASPLYQWKLNGTDISGETNSTYTFIPVNGNAISCILTSNATCATGTPAVSNEETMVVNPLLPVSLTISPSLNNVCAGTPVTFSSNIVNGGTAPLYQWKLNNSDIPGATNSTYGYTPLNGQSISCVLTSNAICPTGNPAESNSVVMVVNPLLPVVITVSPSANPVCAGTSVTFNSNITNGGASPLYQWKLNGGDIPGATNPTYSYTPVNGNAISCVLTSNAVCAIGTPAPSNVVTMTVNPLLPVSVSISASANNVCAGTSVTFTATPVNGGSTPLYQWKLGTANIGGATNATYTTIPANNQAFSCVLTSNATCATGTPATSNTVTMTVIPLVPVSVSITASLYAVMPGTPVTFTATTVNGGPAPAYQWQVNAINAGTNSDIFTYTPGDHDKVTCIVTSNLAVTCLSSNPATSNAIYMVVYTTGTPCAGLPTVSYGGTTYNTVQVGTQCWLRESLNVGTKVLGTANQTNNSTIEKYCYGNADINCNIYGGLYQWAEMVQYLNNATNTTNWSPVPTGNVKGICPDGWHIPTNAEWGALMTNLGGQGVTGGKIKEATLAHFITPNAGATNSSGFTALGAGLRYTTGVFYYIKEEVSFWTISPGANPATDVYYGGATYSIPSATNGQFYKTNGVSVRCLKD